MVRLHDNDQQTTGAGGMKQRRLGRLFTMSSVCPVYVAAVFLSAVFHTGAQEVQQWYRGTRAAVSRLAARVPHKLSVTSRLLCPFVMVPTHRSTAYEGFFLNPSMS